MGNAVATAWQDEIAQPFVAIEWFHLSVNSIAQGHFEATDNCEHFLGEFDVIAVEGHGSAGVPVTGCDVFPHSVFREYVFELFVSHE